VRSCGPNRAEEFVLSTKVGRLLRPRRGAGDTGGSIGSFVGALPNDAVYDFSADAVRRSLDESVTRLGLDRIDIAFIHDPDDYFDAALRAAYPVLRDLRGSGVLQAIGAGMNQWQMLARFIERCDLDVVLLAGRYTLLDRGAGETFLPLCLRREVAVVAGGVFNSGILAQAEPRDDATCNYVQSPARGARAGANDGARLCPLRNNAAGCRRAVPAAQPGGNERAAGDAQRRRSRREHRCHDRTVARRAVARTRPYRRSSTDRPRACPTCRTCDDGTDALGFARLHPPAWAKPKRDG